ncbi:unnamed protein product [Phytophthora fragariaefolia]|uniref:Unnamed protein product n=1 Tax=Phytophthora fragariaefolia TaxID=1490495 RepID=A0A9W6U3S6_9STRA|nr:unnamed protein product [Phytophthora fragariaefolia]
MSTKELIPKVVEFRRGRPRWVHGPPSHVPGASTSVAVSSQRRPSDDGGKVEGEIYQRLLAAQPATMERVLYTTPTKILRRPSESSEGSESDRDDQAECATATTEPSTEMGAEVTEQEEALPKTAAHSDRVSEGLEVTQLKCEGTYLAAATVSEDWGDRDASKASEHPGNEIEFEDYARELAFLPNASLLGALNYYSRFIQDFAVYGAALYQMCEEDFGPGGDPSTAKRSFAALQAKVADVPILRHFDRDKAVHSMLFANVWTPSTTLMQEHDRGHASRPFLWTCAERQ